MKFWEAELWQGGVMVAGVSAESEAEVRREINHYALMYSQDGPVETRVFEQDMNDDDK